MEIKVPSEIEELTVNIDPEMKTLVKFLKPFLFSTGLGLTNESDEFAKAITNNLLKIIFWNDSGNHFIEFVRDYIPYNNQITFLKTLVKGNIGSIEFMPPENGSKPISSKIRILSQIIDVFLNKYPDGTKKLKFIQQVREIPGLPDSVRKDFLWL